MTAGIVESSRVRPLAYSLRDAKFKASNSSGIAFCASPCAVLIATQVCPPALEPWRENSKNSSRHHHEQPSPVHHKALPLESTRLIEA